MKDKHINISKASGSSHPKRVRASIPLSSFKNYKSKKVPVQLEWKLTRLRANIFQEKLKS